MGDGKWANNPKFLILVLAAIALAIFGLFSYCQDNGIPGPTSPISPTEEPTDIIEPVSPLPTVETSEIETKHTKVASHKFNSLKGEIKWFDGFYTWNPRDDDYAYPFITGTISIYWQDKNTGIRPAAITQTTPIWLVVELVLSGTNIYTDRLAYNDLVIPDKPGDGVFFQPTWVWLDIEPDTYNEYIRAYWLYGPDKQTMPISLVRNSQVITPVTGFVLYRHDLIIEKLMYLPIVMKAR